MFSHLVVLQVEGLYGREGVEHESRKYLDTIGRQVQDLEGGTVSQKRAIEESSILQ